jgi:hypothetical protein
VRVDQPGNQDMVVEHHLRVIGETSGGLLAGHDRLDPAVAHGDGMVLQHRASGLYWNDPAGADYERISVPCFEIRVDSSSPTLAYPGFQLSRAGSAPGTR